jgi:DNA-binding IclR family transcriptional regulator
MIVTVTDLENIRISRSSLPKPERERMVWEAAKDPVGLSVSKLSVVTDIGVEEVKRIVRQLHSEGLLSRKPRGHFMGWVSVDRRRARARFHKL